MLWAAKRDTRRRQNCGIKSKFQTRLSEIGVFGDFAAEIDNSARLEMATDRGRPLTSMSDRIKHSRVSPFCMVIWIPIDPRGWIPYSRPQEFRYEHAQSFMLHTVF